MAAAARGSGKNFRHGSAGYGGSNMNASKCVNAQVVTSQPQSGWTRVPGWRAFQAVAAAKARTSSWLVKPTTSMSEWVSTSSRISSTVAIPSLNVLCTCRIALPTLNSWPRVPAHRARPVCEKGTGGAAPGQPVRTAYHQPPGHRGVCGPGPSGVGDTTGPDGGAGWEAAAW